MSSRTSSCKKSSSLESTAQQRVPLGRVSNSKLSATNSQNSIQFTRKPSVIKTEATITLQGSHFEKLPDFKFDIVQIGEAEDPMDVVQYEHIIYRTLRQREFQFKKVVFEQSEITLLDRNLIIDALCRFHYKLGLTTNTLYRFIGIFDRFIDSVHDIPSSKLRVLSCAAFLIASKIEDIIPAQSPDLIKLSENAFTASDLFAAEVAVINAVCFQTTFGTPLFFLTHIMRIEEETKENLLLARYILEIIQTHEFFFGELPSKMASIAIAFTRYLKGKQVWPKSFEGYTRYSFDDIKEGCLVVHEMLSEADRVETKFMRRKYGSELFLGVARINLPESFP